MMVLQRAAVRCVRGVHGGGVSSNMMMLRRRCIVAPGAAGDSQRIVVSAKWIRRETEWSQRQQRQRYCQRCCRVISRHSVPHSSASERAREFKERYRQCRAMSSSESATKAKPVSLAVKSPREHLQYIFDHAISSVEELNQRHVQKMSDGVETQIRNKSARSTHDRGLAIVVPCERENARFGDYQCNDAMGLFQKWSPGKGKKKKGKSKKDSLAENCTQDKNQDLNTNPIDPLFKNPRDVAEAIVSALNEYVIENESCSGIIDETSIAGPGFVNITLKTEYMEKRIMEMMRSTEGLRDWAPSLMKRQGNGIESLNEPKKPVTLKCVIDYSSPNIAKEMHVGHLRSTIIGDTLANMIEFCNGDVLRLNHVGDWGTQFGMLIEYMRESMPELTSKIENAEVSYAIKAHELSIGDLQDLYRNAKQRFDEDSTFKLRAQESVVQLQQGDKASKKIWEAICEASRLEFNRIYDRLQIVGLLERGESFYNSLIPNALDDLKNKNIASIDDGALCVFPFGKEEVPLIVQKSDGGFNYASTDLAAIRQRIEVERADWIIYVTDVGQKNHFDNVIKTARIAGWLPEDRETNNCPQSGKILVSHVGFGLVLGEDGKRFRTRSGDVVRLADLLDEAKQRCREQLDERDSIPEIDRDRVAEVLGYGAVKYADLSNNRQSNYTFSFDKMLDMKGNTAIYMQYAHARISSMVEKSGADIENLTKTQEIKLVTAPERRLALSILRFPEALTSSIEELMPSKICDYMYEVSVKFNEFYNECNVLQSEEPTRSSRLLLCEATARVLRQCFQLLGITPLMRL